MNLKDFKRVAEDKDSYTVEHPSGKRLFIEKAKLSPSAHKHIQCMAQGGQFDGGGSSTESDQSISDLGGGDPTAGIPRTPAATVTPDQVSALGGGNPTASFTFADDLGKLAGKSEPFPQQNFDDVNVNGGTIPGSTIAALRKFPLHGASDETPPLPNPGDIVEGKQYVGPAGTDPMDRADSKNWVSVGAAASNGSSVDYSPKGGGRAPDASQDPLLEQKQGTGELLQEQIKQQQEALNAGQAAGKDVAKVQEGEAAALGNLPSYNDIVAKYQAKDQQLAQSYADAKIDPEHFLHSMSTGSKILTGIGMVLSGMGSATTRQPNYAMQVVDDAIKRDVEAQATDKSSKMNLWKMNREALGNDMQANKATENQIMAGALAKLQAAQTRAALPQEKLRAQVAIDDLKKQMLQNNMVRGMLSAGQQGAQGQSGTLSGTDPSLLVPEMVKDPAQQKAVYEEIKNRQNIARNGSAMLKAFDQAANEVSGVGGVVHSAVEKTPGQLQLEQLMMPNMSELDGTIRKSAVDAAHQTIIPGPADLGRADRIASKRQSLIDWMKSQQASPVSKGNLLDLDRFQSTAIPSTPAKTAPTASAQPQTIDRRAKDGRIIIYDAKTKQPIGVKK